MRTGERRLFLAVLAVLLVALVLLAGQWALGSDGPKIHHVSVLLDGAESESWKNFRAGLNQAALEQNVDLRFISRYDGENTQADALVREWEGEADGVVIVPGNGAALGEALKKAPSGLAVAVMGPRLSSEQVDCYISPDYVQMGRRLADAAAEQGEDCTLFLSPSGDGAARQIAEGLVGRLRELGIPCGRVVAQSVESVAVLPAGTLVAVEGTMTEELCQRTEAAGRVCGVGVSGRLLRYLEEGTAAALVVQSDFDAGYLSLTSVVAGLSHGNMQDTVLESYTATGENMFGDPMIDILFAKR